MAMTKKERSELEAAKTAAALHWTSPVPFDVGVPDSGSVSGWCYNHFSNRVWEGWTEKHRHGSGKAPSQNYSCSSSGMAMHSTKLLALKAMRYAFEVRVAGELRAIDKMIEEAKKAELEAASAAASLRLTAPPRPPAEDPDGPPH